MPVVEVRKARTCVVLRRPMAPGYPGVDTPPFRRENTRMPSGDAKAGIAGVLKALKGSGPFSEGGKRRLC